MSVVVTTFDRARLLAAALESVAAQTFSELEVIVVDDGSTDDTIERARAVDAPILLLRLDHTGHLAGVRNRGVAVARGELVAFLDDDDVWLPNKLEKQMELLDDGEVALSYTGARHLNADGTQSEPWTPPAPAPLRAFASLLRECFIHPSTVVIRRAAYDRNGGFDETLADHADYLLWLRVARRERLARLAEPAVLVRLHPVQLSRQGHVAISRNVVVMFDRLAETTPLLSRESRQVRRAISRYHAHIGGLLLAEDQAAASRQAFLRSLVTWPLQRRSWRGLGETYRGVRS